jgi:hypothetical protein
MRAGQKQLVNNVILPVHPVRTFLMWFLLIIYSLSLIFLYINPFGIDEKWRLTTCILLALTYVIPFTGVFWYTSEYVYNYYHVPYEVILDDDGFAVNYRSHRTRGGRWSDCVFFHSDTDIGPPNKHSNNVIYFSKTIEGYSQEIKGLSWDVAEEIRRRRTAYFEKQDISTEEAVSTIKRIKAKLIRSSLDSSTRRNAEKLLELSVSLSGNRSYAAKALKYATAAEKIIDKKELKEIE